MKLIKFKKVGPKTTRVTLDLSDYDIDMLEDTIVVDWHIMKEEGRDKECKLVWNWGIKLLHLIFMAQGIVQKDPYYKRYFEKKKKQVK